MDISETYVKMCDCEQIQDEHKYEDGDFLCYFHKGKYEKVFVYTYGHMVSYESGDRDIWLPRQDQIQDMFDYPTLIISHHSGEYIIEFWPEGKEIDKESLERMYQYYYAKSMEQAWLMCYMYKKHDKVWAGKTWGKQ